MAENKFLYHAMALTAAAVWGVTFVSTKVLLAAGLMPADIMLYRFAIAYLCLAAVAPRKLFANNLKDELLMLGAGMSGGSLYFFIENTALMYTQASNLAILLSIVPLLTAVTVSLLYHEHITKALIVGFIVSFAGVTMVVLNGNRVLHLSPKGDMLTLVAAVLWVVYSIIIMTLQKRGYNSLLITRKVFFYGILTILPAFLIHPLNCNMQILARPEVWGNLLFLGAVASLGGYALWNMSVEHLGAVIPNLYLYVSPPVTLVASSIVLSEKITVVAVAGMIMILAGVFTANDGYSILHKRR